MTAPEAARQLGIPATTLIRWLEGEQRGGAWYPPVLREEPTGDAKAETKPDQQEPAQQEAKPATRPLPPGWFRAAPQMMSLVGCSEPEMAEVLRGLGYRVHPPTEETGPLHAFSVKPRFVREREEQRERQRLQERERREQRRRERPERPNERQFFADAPRGDSAGRDGPNPGAANRGAPNRDGPNRDGQRRDGPRSV